MRYFKFLLIFIIFFSSINFTLANAKVAFIDVQYIMENSLAGQSLKKQLESIHKKNLKDFKYLFH